MMKGSKHLLKVEVIELRNRVQRIPAFASTTEQKYRNWMLKAYFLHNFSDVLAFICALSSFNVDLPFDFQRTQFPVRLAFADDHRITRLTIALLWLIGEELSSLKIERQVGRWRGC